MHKRSKSLISLLMILMSISAALMGCGNRTVHLEDSSQETVSRALQEAESESRVDNKAERETEEIKEADEGDREYYASIPELPENGEKIPDFENGDITYYTTGKSLAIFSEMRTTPTRAI